MNVSVIIPVYNSEASLVPLVDRLLPVLDANADQYEIILINDCSTDKSWEIICSVKSKHDCINNINLMRNYGQHNALLCGIRLAHHEIIITLDDDLQHPPEEIPKLLSKLNEGFDVVYGTPTKERHGLWRDIASKLTKWTLQTAMGAEIAQDVGAFRAIRTQVREAFYEYKSPFVNIDVLLTWGTTEFAAVPVRHEMREIGVSNYTVKKLIIHALNMLTGFSTLPLQIASILGFIFMLFGLIILGYVFINFLHNRGAVPGFTFIASIVSIFSGVQLFVLGIIGEYLARIHFRTFNKPSYVIRNKND